MWSRWAFRLSPLLALLGCARSYIAESPRTVRAGALNARVDGLRTDLGMVHVRLQAAARPGVALHDARLSAVSRPACSGGKTFARIESNGSTIDEGPLDLAGSHTLRLTYEDGPGFPTLRAGAAVDLEVIEASRRTCVRVPVVQASGAPTWKLAPSTHVALGSRLRVFPVSIHDPGQVTPDSAVLLRLAVTSPSFGVWVDSAAGFGDGPGERTSTDVLVAGGAELALFRTGDWAVLADGGYEVVWYLERASQREQGKFRYLFHGPELAPKLAYTLWSVPSLPTLPSGSTLNLELELPVALWIGRGDAPRTTFLAGVGVGALGVF